MSQSAPLVGIDLPGVRVPAGGIVAFDGVLLHARKAKGGIVLHGDGFHPTLKTQLAQRQRRIAGRFAQAPLQRRQPLLQLIHPRGRKPHALPLIPTIEGIQHVL